MTIPYPEIDADDLKVVAACNAVIILPSLFLLFQE